MVMTMIAVVLGGDYFHDVHDNEDDVDNDGGSEVYGAIFEEMKWSFTIFLAW